MRDLGILMGENTNNGTVMREAVKNMDFDTIDLLSCGSGYDVSDEELDFYLENKTFEGLIFEVEG